MPSVPILSRLGLRDYERIFVTLLILALEGLLRMIMYIFPVSLFDWMRFKFANQSFPRIFKGVHDEEISEIKDPFVGIRNTADLIACHGYEAEEHNVITPDGYLLVIHRVRSKVKNENNDKSPVLLMHGCMMSSEVWVCLRSSKKCLPLVLADAGYDVWLGNVRGNKYCQKHVNWTPSQNEFWDFSLDEIVMHDIPAIVDHILMITQKETISYIGFSQGSTVGFATLALSKLINSKVNVMIALAATTKPKGMTNRLVQALIKATPELIFLVFSRRVFISSVSFWRELFSPRAYVYAIDTCLKGLFGWSCANLLYTDKIVAYQHLYAFTSSKLIAHWFQIMREKRFQMFDEGSPVRFGEGPLVPTFNLRNIKTPIALFLGGLDTLVDNKWTKEHLKSVVRTVEISDYEHLDFLWGKNIDEILFPEIFDILSNKASEQFPPEPARAKIFLSLMKVLIGIITVLVAANTLQPVRKNPTTKALSFHPKGYADEIDPLTNGYRLLHQNTAFETGNCHIGEVEQLNERPEKRQTSMENIKRQMNGSSLYKEPNQPRIRKENITITVKHTVIDSSVSQYRFNVFVNILIDYVERYPDSELPDHFYLVDFFFPFRMQDRMVFDLLQKIEGCFGVWKKYGSGVKAVYASLTEALKVAKYFKPGSSPDGNPLPDGAVIEYHRNHFYESQETFFAH